jgi:hypothetical protein
MIPTNIVVCTVSALIAVIAIIAVYIGGKDRGGEK